MSTKEKIMTPSEYFDVIKGKRDVMTGDKLTEIYENALSLANKYKITGQLEHMKKLLFCMDCVEKQRKLIEMGLTTYVSKSDVEDFIDNVSDDTVKIIELERYPREIPDEICEIIPKVKDIFDSLYIVYTDYTGRTERKVAQEKKDKDPILFGVFEDEKTRTMVNEWFYLGDWIDEYCDLTLEKMITQMSKNDRPNIAKELFIPSTAEELKAYVSSVKQDNKGNWNIDTQLLENNLKKTSKLKTFVNKVKTFFDK